MLAAVYEHGGEAHEVLDLRELPTPQPGPGEVRVRLRVSAVNPTDWKSRSRRSPLPYDLQIPNQDGAGEIDAVGEGVDRGRVGTRVWVYFAARERPQGTAAQWTVVPAEHAVELPDDVDLDMGAMMGIPAVTAHYCLFADGPIDGVPVLVAGGAGAVGHFAIELARRAGAHPIATVSSEQKAELARAAGAETVVNYREEGAAERIRAAAPDGVGRVIEVALEQNLELDLVCCARGAVICTYADNGREVPINVRRLMTENLLLRFALIYNVAPAQLRQAARDITAALSERALTPLPIHRFPLERIADAHRAVEDGATGKVLVDIP